jgi:hypothetical protein
MRKKQNIEQRILNVNKKEEQRRKSPQKITLFMLMFRRN